MKKFTCSYIVSNPNYVRVTPEWKLNQWDCPTNIEKMDELGVIEIRENMIRADQINVFFKPFACSACWV